MRPVYRVEVNHRASEMRPSARHPSQTPSALLKQSKGNEPCKCPGEPC